MKAGPRPSQRHERRAAPARPARAAREPPALPGAGAWFLAAWAALLLIVPPASNWFWAVNGFRSLPEGARGALALAALAALGLVLLRVRSRPLAMALALAAALAVAFPLRERIHLLGDTQLRLRAMAIFTAHLITPTLGEWSTRLHANPLDIAVDFLGAIALRGLGASLTQAVSLVSLALAGLYLAGAWRAVGRLAPAPDARLALCAAVVVSGTLEAFAGYAESAGLLLAAAAWWWAEMLRPLDGTRQAVRVAAAWLALFLAHRLALVMLLPLAWRILGTPLPGDRPEARARLLEAAALAAALAAATLALGVGGRQLGVDAREILNAILGAARAVPPSDWLNELALVAPLACLTPWLVGRAALTGALSRPEARLLLVGAAPLVPLLWLLPSAPSGLGMHRDWDLGVLAGLSLSLTAAALLARLPSSRLRGALLCLLPLLALQSGGWLAVNASEAASLRRARALVEQPPGLAQPHLSHLHLYLGQRAMDLGLAAAAAPEFEASFRLDPNPRRALFAAEAWARAGSPAAARAALARARATGPLVQELEASARRLDALVARMSADSARAAGAAPPARP
ncbi:MAG: hypothetical protein E6K81_02025 [Candidatus Eisenbacteria bacterium]|uniref:Tetratricopeptide repeat protein n=1 Tax=Eiseniibacteriota bacterium TaxID=2212470 RepID=A0A538UDG7_UNCEI|nr:MAG: hypothetical protein E6K81_02025 [Candidatus Eisenbacteria bacterium]